MAEKCCDDHCHSGSECEEKSVQTRGDSVDKNATNNAERCSCDHHDKENSTGSSAPGSSNASLIDLKQLAFLNFGGSSHASVKTVDEAKIKKYQFWETQPVPKFGIRTKILPMITYNFITI